MTYPSSLTSPDIESRPASTTHALRRLRLARGLTQLELALAIGVSQSQISRAESGGRFALHHWEALAAYFEVPIETFVRDIMARSRRRALPTAPLPAIPEETVRPSLTLPLPPDLLVLQSLGRLVRRSKVRRDARRRIQEGPR